MVVTGPMGTSHTPSSTPRTITLEKLVKCPECGREGKLVLKSRGRRWYAYCYHGYVGGKKLEHYIGPCPDPSSSQFDEWIKQIEAKRCLRIWLPVEVYERLLEIAARRKKYVEELIEELVIKLATEEREKALESMLRSMSQTTPQPQPSQPEKPARRGKAGLLSWI